MERIAPYQPKHKVRIVTAASLFDGHDAAINIMRRILQSSGAEIIHLGHNRSVRDIVDTAIQEDVQGIAITSYQGGHTEYLKYMHDLLKEKGAGHIKIFGGGGGGCLLIGISIISSTLSSSCPNSTSSCSPAKFQLIASVTSNRLIAIPIFK